MDDDATIATSDVSANGASMFTPETELFHSINALRAAGTRCGAEAKASVSLIVRTDALDALAYEHAQDMAVRGYFNHVSPDGLGPPERARRAGYGAAIAENLAWGQSTPAGALAAWQRSAGHCRNVMDPKHRAVGVARVIGNRKMLWVAVFGATAK